MVRGIAVAAAASKLIAHLCNNVGSCETEQVCFELRRCVLPAYICPPPHTHLSRGIWFAASTAGHCELPGCDCLECTAIADPCVPQERLLWGLECHFARCEMCKLQRSRWHTAHDQQVLQVERPTIVKVSELRKPGACQAWQGVPEISQRCIPRGTVCSTHQDPFRNLPLTRRSMHNDNAVAVNPAAHSHSCE
jgi:hypothetical protein